MTVFEFILSSLVVHRLALMLSQEDGPAWIFRKLRNAPPKKSSTYDGIRCLLCVSVWISGLVTGFWIFEGSITWTYSWIYWLAFSSAAIAWHMQFTADL